MNKSRITRTLSGKVVAVTGAARGIGLATATASHRYGARVVLGDIDEAEVKASGARLGGDVEAVRLDVTDEDSFAAFLRQAESRFGAVDVLINNAGIMPIGPFLDEPNALSKRALDINVAGAVIGMRAVLPAMIARGSGHIVNVASIAGKSPVPGGLIYAASKAAVISATETARVEFAGTGVSFTCVLPSFTNTDLISGTTGTKFIANLEPEQVAEAIVGAVVARKPDLYLPAAVGVIARTQPLLGRRLRDRLNHLIGADRTFLVVDHEARGAYDARIGVTAPPD
ncbi:SDR family oxidoreductase [Nocardia bovistercoris]|uniref:SDR family oxidoreductase n=1 Tax=Nocardia bovistercoris TaxID=2785916 RepID=A0A931IA60_9NOCA|nr:SDR family oxidoreductase [Nocardia bovistercoris]MBH0776713.1 SDR family oxidoreductase [Nocardia bovistercoris]